MKNTGRKYEIFVAAIQQAILNSEEFTAHKNIKVETNKKITDNCGNDREFDIYWEYELGGLLYKTVIECKDYTSKIPLEKIDALLGKARDIPDLKLVFATKVGYQSGVKNKAERNNIDLLIVREQNDSDWKNLDGTPLMKQAIIHIELFPNPEIQRFEPLVDGEWLKANTNIDITQPINFSVLNNEMFIEDFSNKEKYSIYELSSRLAPLNVKSYGTFEDHVKFEEAYIYYQDVKLKLVSYKIKYQIPKPITETIEIDFTKELTGVVEYLQKGTKKSIFKNGMIRTDTN